MKNKINKISLTNKLIAISILLVAITNPWSIGYISLGLDWLSENITTYSHYAFIPALVLLIGTNIYIMYSTRDKVTVTNARDKK